VQGSGDHVESRWLKVGHSGEIQRDGSIGTQVFDECPAHCLGGLGGQSPGRLEGVVGGRGFGSGPGLALANSIDGFDAGPNGLGRQPGFAANPAQRIDTRQQDINGVATESDLTFLSGDEAIFKGMSHLHRIIHTDDAGRPFDGMGRTHESFQPARLIGIAFQGQQPFGQLRQMCVEFRPEQIQKGRVDVTVLAHGAPR
jgi:hypothetical protein